MAKCAARTLDGQPCRAQAIRGSDRCFTHNPAQGEARAKARKLGGQRRRVGHAGDPPQMPDQVRSLADVMNVLDYTLAEALALDNSIQRGRLLVALCAAFTEAIKTGELEARLAAVEKSAAEKGAKHDPWRPN